MKRIFLWQLFLYILHKEFKIALFGVVIPYSIVDRQQYFGGWNGHLYVFRMEAAHLCGMLVPMFQLYSIHIMLLLRYTLICGSLFCT